jgi:hypothetical protein
LSHAFETVFNKGVSLDNDLTTIHTHSLSFDRYITRDRSDFPRCHPEMRGPPLQPAPWSPPNESIYKSPHHPYMGSQSPFPQAHHIIRATSYNYPPPPHIDDAAEAPIVGNCWPTEDLASHGMAASTGSTFTSIAPPIHVQYHDYDHTQHPHDRLNIHLSAPPPHLEPASVEGFSRHPVSPRPTLVGEQTSRRLPDNETNLKKMRHERELVFQKAATELDQARCNTGPSAPTNKAWDDAWAILRENMTKM